MARPTQQAIRGALSRDMRFEPGICCNSAGPRASAGAESAFRTWSISPTPRTRRAKSPRRIGRNTRSRRAMCASTHCHSSAYSFFLSAFPRAFLAASACCCCSWVAGRTRPLASITSDPSEQLSGHSTAGLRDAPSWDGSGRLGAATKFCRLVCWVILVQISRWNAGHPLLCKVLAPSPVCQMRGELVMNSFGCERADDLETAH